MVVHTGVSSALRLTQEDPMLEPSLDNERFTETPPQSRMAGVQLSAKTLGSNPSIATGKQGFMGPAEGDPAFQVWDLGRSSREGLAGPVCELSTCTWEAGSPGAAPDTRATQSGGWCQSRPLGPPGVPLLG